MNVQCRVDDQVLSHPVDVRDHGNVSTVRLLPENRRYVAGGALGDFTLMHNQMMNIQIESMDVSWVGLDSSLGSAVRDSFRVIGWPIGRSIEIHVCWVRHSTHPLKL